MAADSTDDATDKGTLYDRVIELIFDAHYTAGATEIAWTRPEINDATDALGSPRIGNLGDVPYAFRYRRALPDSIKDRAPDGMEWIIRGDGRAKYKFVAIPAQARVKPNPMLVTTKIPDSTPEIIGATALNDEQALLALVRYNRLIDVFLGVTAYSLQNHLRTTARGIGQVEVDELYVAVDRWGEQYILPVQAKGGNDELGVTQAEQDLAVCRDKWPKLVARPIAAQFMAGGVIALFELTVQDDQIRVLREAHYKLVPAKEIDDQDRAIYRQAAGAGVADL
ncbi:hypothetical protein [Cellulomonas sp. HZM]|uniref:hypothetical protein n=1 Tax=Cellulomonas sp. HZM TaxID=1454010 RepID=UPI0005545290|nr:hypothetical protein [Cellulomonas sp. HZM]